MDVMLDLETLSTRPNATIVTFGACKFSPYNQNDITDGIYFRINVDEQLALGRHLDEGTIAWWGTQAEDVREEALGEGNRITLEEFTQNLNRFLVGADNIWAQGPVFDIVILENLYRQLEKPCPWQFWQIRDSRTLLSSLGDPREKNKAGLHNALEDAVSQAQAVQYVFKQAGITEKR
jgi:hypothetical protein